MTVEQRKEKEFLTYLFNRLKVEVQKEHIDRNEIKKIIDSIFFKINQLSSTPLSNTPCESRLFRTVNLTNIYNNYVISEYILEMLTMLSLLHSFLNRVDIQKLVKEFLEIYKEDLKIYKRNFIMEV